MSQGIGLPDQLTDTANGLIIIQIDSAELQFEQLVAKLQAMMSYIVSYLFGKAFDIDDLKIKKIRYELKERLCWLIPKLVVSIHYLSNILSLLYEAINYLGEL